MEEPPQIAGSTSKRQKIEKKENEQKLLMEEVSLLDMETQKPIEENIYDSDILKKPLQQIVSLGKTAVKQNISDKQRATLQKARAVLAEKRRLEKNQKPSGTPAPDILTKVESMFEKKFSDVTSRLDNLQKIVAYEAPLQVNHQVDTSKMQLKESIDNNTFINHAIESKKQELFDLMKYLPPKSELQNVSKVKEISDSMKTIQFQNDKLWERVKNDSSLNSNTKSNSVFLF